MNLNPTKEVLCPTGLIEFLVKTRNARTPVKLTLKNRGKEIKGTIKDISREEDVVIVKICSSPQEKCLVVLTSSIIKWEENK